MRIPGMRMLKIFFAGIALILMLFAVEAYQAIEGFSSTEATERVAAVEAAIRKSAVSCYAFEGSYPPLAYLVERYGVVLNEDAYYYHYETMGSNMMPVIEVYRKW